jgi:hypothetical protein
VLSEDVESAKKSTILSVKSFRGLYSYGRGEINFEIVLKDELNGVLKQLYVGTRKTNDDRVNIRYRVKSYLKEKRGWNMVLDT